MTCLLSNKVLHVQFNVSTASLPYSMMRFLGVPLESGIMMIFAPDSIQPDCFSLSSKLLLNRLMDFDFTLNSSGRFRIALLNSFIPVVEV